MPKSSFFFTYPVKVSSLTSKFNIRCQNSCSASYFDVICQTITIGIPHQNLIPYVKTALLFSMSNFDHADESTQLNGVLLAHLLVQLDVCPRHTHRRAQKAPIQVGGNLKKTRWIKGTTFLSKDVNVNLQIIAYPSQIHF